MEILNITDNDNTDQDHINAIDLELEEVLMENNISSH